MMTLSQEEKGLPQKISDDNHRAYFRGKFEAGRQTPPMKPFSRSAWMWEEVLSGKP